MHSSRIVETRTSAQSSVKVVVDDDAEERKRKHSTLNSEKVTANPSQRLPWPVSNMYTRESGFHVLVGLVVTTQGVVQGIPFQHDSTK